MATILSIETSTTNCSVAVARDGELLFLQEDMGRNYSHSERLHDYILSTLKKSGIDKSEVDAIAVSQGPGSYTGLRIGVSSAKGLCYALTIKLIAIETLQALAYQVQEKEVSYIIPLLDARRMEVYSAVFDATYTRVRETKAEILTEESYYQYLDKGKTVFIGNGAEKLKEICNHKNASFITEALPSAREMVPLAEYKYKISDIEDVAYFEPYYLKDFLVAKPKKH